MYVPYRPEERDRLAYKSLKKIGFRSSQFYFSDELVQQFCNVIKLTSPNK